MKKIQKIVTLILIVSLTSPHFLYPSKLLAPAGVSNFDSQLFFDGQTTEKSADYNVTIQPYKNMVLSRLLNRTVEIGIASVLLLAFAAPMAFIAVMIKINEPYFPVLYKDPERVGLHGKTFTIYKFRTMKPSEDKSPVISADDKRVTKIGKFLRKTALDELPRFFNVLKGDMSLVGRIPLQKIDLIKCLDNEGYSEYEQKDCNKKPGIWGPAQLASRQSEHPPPFKGLIQIERNYSPNRTLWKDMKIIFLICVKLTRAAFPVKKDDKKDRHVISKNRKPLSIVIIQRQIETIGGEERYITELIHAIARKYNIRLHIIYFSKEKSQHYEKHIEQGIIIFHPIYSPAGRWKHASPQSFWKVYKTLKEIIAKEKVDVINLHCLVSPVLGLVSLAMARAYGIPLMTTVHHVAIRWKLNLHGTIGKVILHLNSFMADLNTGLSNDSTRALSTNALTIGTFIDTDTFDPLRIDKNQKNKTIDIIKEDKNNGKKIIVYVTRIIPGKCQLDFVEVAQSLRELGIKNSCIYTIGPVSDEKYKEKIEREVENAGLKNNIKILPKVKFDEVAGVYALADVAAVPTEFEGLPRSILEPLAMEVPVVTYNVPGVRDNEALLHGKTGFLVKFGDTEAMARKIFYLLKNPERARQMGREGRKFVMERYNLNDLADRYIETWIILSNEKSLHDKKPGSLPFLKTTGYLRSSL